MNFEHSDKVKDLLARVSKFMDDNIYPAEAVYAEQMQALEMKAILGKLFQ